MAPKLLPDTRHVISINDLSRTEIETVFDVAQSYLTEFGDPNSSHRIGRSSNLAPNFILASLFYEPSTRTRLSFESAMLRLGGTFITSADPATSSAAKGESLADSVRVIANYADVMVIRHPRDGAARLAAEFSSIPVINGGDGSHEHPTQTLCDLFTLRKKNKRLKNLKVAIAGDLRGSRTIHSFVYALARFGADIVPMPAQGLELPPHVDRRLREEFHCNFVPGSDSIDALYRTPEEPHQPALFAGPDFEISINVGGNGAGDDAIQRKKIDAVYVTRYQKERAAEATEGYPKIDAQFLKEPKYSHASVLHPLPRVDELDASLDSDNRAVYFEQAAYGVPVRMALISLLLGLQKGASLRKFEGGFEKPENLVYQQLLSAGIRCTNANCIVHEPKESPYVRNKFYVVKSGDQRSCRLRCMYCETDIDRFVVASKKNKWYTDDTSALLHTKDQSIKDLLAFADEAEATAHGFHFRRQAAARGPQHESTKSRSHS